MLRRSEKIEGVDLEGIINLLNQFADDLNTTLKFSQETLDEVLNIFEIFRKNSGFTLSYEKTTVYRLGSLKHSNARLYTRFPLQWSNQPLKVLGIYITPNEKEIMIQ